MIFHKKKDFNFRQLFSKSELDLCALKFVFTNYLSNRFVDSKSKSKSVLFFNKAFSRHKSSKTKIVRRCVLTNRSRGVIRKFGVSRILLKDLILTNRLNGYKKLSW